MKRAWCLVSLAVTALIYGYPAAAQESSALPDEIQKEMAATRSDCSSGDAAFGPKFIRQSNVLGPNAPLFVLDYGDFICGGSRTLYCGTAGCLTQIYVRRDSGAYEKIFDENVQSLEINKKKGQVSLSTDLHGNECGKAGFEKCGMTLYWNGNKFSPAH